MFLEELTWIEVRDMISSGKTTIIISTGGTEQDRTSSLESTTSWSSSQQAKSRPGLRTALVAPVVAYVPEGDVDPPTGHMRYAGTITTPQGH